MKLRSLGFALFTCAVSLQANEATQEKKNVVDYFLLLPAEQFEAPTASWLRHMQNGQGKIDIANGFLHCEGDGGQPNFDVALFRFKNGKPLVALCTGELEGDDNVFLYFYELGANGKMQEVKRAIFPFSNEKDWRFALPRVGRTIEVRKQGTKKVLHRMTWDGERFEETK